MRFAIAPLLALLALLACSPAPPPQQQPDIPPAPTLPPAATLLAPSAPEPQQPWSYSPGLRDPFRLPLPVEPPPQDPALLVLCGLPCAWELDQLALVGLVSGTTSPVAVVEDPEGRGHLLQLGSFVGSRGGKVERILRTTLLVSERGARGPVLRELRIQPARGQPPVDLLPRGRG